MKKIELLIFLRGIKRHKADTLFKILGLSIGMSALLLISAFICDQLSYDQFHKDARNIYRIHMEYTDRNGQASSSPMVAPLVTDHILQSIPEINAAARVFSYSWKEEALIEAGEKRFYEGKLLLTDPSFFTLFSFALINGDKEHVFAEPNAVVLSKSCSLRYFGEEDPLGKILRIKNFGNKSLVVTGVIEDAPDNSHFSFDLLAPLSLGEELYWKPFHDTWFGLSFYTYIRIEEGTDPKELELSINNLIHDVADPRLGEQSYTLFPLTKIHLGSHHTTELEAGGNMLHILFALVAGVIIFLICLSNYTAITISQIHFRKKEVGIKKLFGRTRIRMTIQTFTESFIFSLSGFIIAMILLEMFSPAIIEFLGIDLSTSSNANFFLFGSCLVLIFSLLAGLSPSILYSQFKTVDSLKEKIWYRGGKVSLRKVMLILQFVILSVLLTATFLVGSQHELLTRDQAGLDLSNILVIPLRDHQSTSSYGAFKNEVEKVAGIKAVSYSSCLPVNASSILDVHCEGHDQPFKMVHMDVDFGLPEIYGMKLAGGRFFDPAYSSDEEKAYIINETAAKMLGWNKAEGQKINYSNDRLRFAEFKVGTLIGIVQDFHHSPKHKGIQPFVMKIRKDPRYISVSYIGEEQKSIVPTISKMYEHFFGAPPISYRSAEEINQDLYSEETQMANIFYFCTFLALILACFSVLSISKLEMKIKYRELGIRKVFGAGLRDLLGGSIRNYLILVSVSYVVSIPIVIYFMHIWLSGFAYSVDITIDYFLLAFFIILLSSITIIAIQVVKACGLNPVNILKYE